MIEGEPKTPTLFEQMNQYLRKEASSDIENPTVEGIAARLGYRGMFYAIG
jgi:hypothetical protein